ncbi:N-terminal acetyltransferase complex subunit ARD1, putative [Eimeria tenella]|uniref:N-terminal acetyltransferase complex subunit ARD1, putative n=1 Tax=Eimeria tenella TaxID=5802 RepID=U6KZ99_EIMTE|nr:N-terminal acetyltransferase complex subunit ARD1, putative [Eimeria tenella]CDJ43467.1 N-terminal acetyltransferase complex subunit ARD1, putative [Eimeria tenella]|eukprot:XP_013234217.1 N-terminal acetyltransferase complex subunit ARD1, putative [Eimeria tenella]
MCSLVRPSDVFDLFEMQHLNFVNLPENYVMKYFFFHSLSWPQLPTVAQDGQGKLVGYVLAKLEDENRQFQKPHGHVTSVAVMRQNRKLGLASKLMRLSQRAMQKVFGAEFAALHVRVTNRAAYALYSKTLGYRVHDIDKSYYADKEDAFNMRNYFCKDKRVKGRRQNDSQEDKTQTPGEAATEQPTAATAAAATTAAEAAATATTAATTAETSATNSNKGAAASPQTSPSAAATSSSSNSNSSSSSSSSSKNRRKKR